MRLENLSKQIIGCAIEVHREMGPGLLESVYERSLALELARHNIAHEVQYPLHVVYKGDDLKLGYRIDILVERQIVLELKTVEQLSGIHEAQLLTYMKLARVNVGLLLNFNSLRMTDGIKRLVL